MITQHFCFVSQDVLVQQAMIPEAVAVLNENPVEVWSPNLDTIGLSNQFPALN
jgi:hypothetical protein